MTELEQIISLSIIKLGENLRLDNQINIYVCQKPERNKKERPVITNIAQHLRIMFIIKCTKFCTKIYCSKQKIWCSIADKDPKLRSAEQTSLKDLPENLTRST